MEYLSHYAIGDELCRWIGFSQRAACRLGKAQRPKRSGVMLGTSLSLLCPTYGWGDLGMKTDHPLLPPLFPETWAESYGQDQYGLWQGAYIEDIETRFRWIPPGEFIMGSPPDEPERDDDEGPQHRVRIEYGFWLAETACTQALWQAVMGENPSYFKGEENPVEKVSWSVVKQFIERTNGRHPGLNLRLPSESEWEYACRAGTSTPFWFGSKLTTDKANFNGGYPYALGPKGEYRERTVPARHFQPNPWGLYQMHGNVWEWCEDRWHDNYKGAPEGGQPWLTGGNKEQSVLRGGSWIHLGGSLRSACRLHASPSNRYDFYGFRLARDPEYRQSSPADPTQRRRG